MALLLPVELSGPINEREAIGDSIFRAVLSFDHADEALLRSAVTEDINAEMPGSQAKGIDQFKAAVWDRVSKLDTTHFISNVRVDIKDDCNARLSASALAQHVRPGKGFEPGNKFTSGGLYSCDVVKVGKLWKLKTWNASIIWVDGDRTVMTGE